jgi:hypothetical protein
LHGVLDHTLGSQETINPQEIICENAFQGLHAVAQHETDCDVKHFWSYHPSGANFTRCDGSTTFLMYSIDPMLFVSLSTRNDR